jgi:hypothetical protein
MQDETVEAGAAAWVGSAWKQGIRQRCVQKVGRSNEGQSVGKRKQGWMKLAVKKVVKSNVELMRERLSLMMQ